MIYQNANVIGKTSLFAERRNVGISFTPLSLSPALWLDFSDRSTLYDATSGGSLVAADGAIARIEDKSGNARHATQATLNNRPILKENIINGLSVGEFDGSNDFLATVAFGGNQTWTRWVVARSSNASQDKVIVGWASSYELPNPGADYTGVESGNQIAIAQNGSIITTKLTSKAQQTGSLGSFVIARHSVAGTNASNTLHVNGSQVTALDNPFTADPGNFTKAATSMGIGAYNGGAGPFAGQIVSVIHVPRACTADEIAATDAYLANRFGITLA